jgi:hypothetical protein
VAKNVLMVIMPPTDYLKEPHTNIEIQEIHGSGCADHVELGLGKIACPVADSIVHM